MPHALLEVAHFFSIYKDLEGKRTEVLGWKDADSAFQLILQCHERFKQSNKDA
jgi:inorganic pyrophosphatase